MIKPRLAFVDGLRGIAVSMVVVDHLFGRIRADLPLPSVVSWILAHGYLGVAIFFVLSGFVITMSVGGRKITPAFAGRFALRRAVRLDPPYWASIIVALGSAVIAARFFGVHKTSPSLREIGAHLVYLQDLLGYENIIAVYWTLCLEVQFYLFLIILLWTMQAAYRRGDSSEILGRTGAQGMLLSLLIISIGQLTDIWHPTPRAAFVPYWFCFTLGAMTYWVLAGWVSRSTLGLAATIVLVSGVLFSNSRCFAAVITATLLYVAGHRDKMTQWLSGTIVQFLGKISYSLYLFHAIIGWSSMSVALRYFPAPMKPWQAVSAALVGISGSIISASVVYALIEKRSVQISRLIRLEPTKVRETHIDTRIPQATNA